MTSLDVNNKMGLHIPYRNFSFVKKSNSTPFWLNIVEIQEWTKNSPYKNVQTHIFEMWRHWMFLDVNKFRTGRVSNTMAFYTVLMWGKRLVIFSPAFIRTLSIVKLVHHKTEFDFKQNSQIASILEDQFINWIFSFLLFYSIEAVFSP